MPTFRLKKPVAQTTEGRMGFVAYIYYLSINAEMQDERRMFPQYAVDDYGIHEIATKAISSGVELVFGEHHEYIPPGRILAVLTRATEIPDANRP